MNLPEMSVIDTHLPSNTKIRGYTTEQMLAWGKACAESERKPLSATVIGNMMPSQIPSEYDGPLMEFARAIEAAHNIGEKT